jgi:hypothetical protein
MGTFDETAIVDYRLLFADQGKQTSIFRLQETNGSCCFPSLSVSAERLICAKKLLKKQLSFYVFLQIADFSSMFLFI